MFQGIYCSGENNGITSSSYHSDGVAGQVSFSVQPNRTCVMSSIGPDDAVLQCVSTHRYRSAVGRHVAYESSEVMDYS